MVLVPSSFELRPALHRNLDHVHRSRVNDCAIFGIEPDSSAGLRGIAEQRADGSGSNERLSDLVFHLVAFLYLQ